MPVSEAEKQAKALRDSNSVLQLYAVARKAVQDADQEDEEGLAQLRADVALQRNYLNTLSEILLLTDDDGREAAHLLRESPANWEVVFYFKTSTVNLQTVKQHIGGNRKYERYLEPNTLAKW